MTRNGRVGAFGIPTTVGRFQGYVINPARCQRRPDERYHRAEGGPYWPEPVQVDPGPNDRFRTGDAANLTTEMGRLADVLIVPQTHPPVPSDTYAFR